MLREGLGVAKGEELGVDFREFDLVQETGGAVLDEALVPLLQLLLVDCTAQTSAREPGTSARELGLKRRGENLQYVCLLNSCSSCAESFDCDFPMSRRERRGLIRAVGSRRAKLAF